jgi:hypothetical protein
MNEAPIGDKDPEDVWDDGDPAAERLRVLGTIVDALEDNRDERFDGRRLNALRLMGKLDAELMRLDDDSLDDRLEEIRARLEAL